MYNEDCEEIYLNYHENKFVQEYKNDKTKEDPAQSLKKREER